MDGSSQPLSAEALLAHADWVRALARTLVREPAAADDVAQAAWLDALRHPPRDASNLRAWFARVVRNAAAQRARSENRRAARERVAARAEALPDSNELVAQAELQRELVGHVLALAEPYRTTVLLRYFEGLEARAIAAKQGIPLATVRTRLQRALAQLRERLDRERGGRAGWQGAFLVLAARGDAAAAGPLSFLLGGASVAIAWKKVGVAALVVAAGWWAWSTRSPAEVAPNPALDSRVADSELRAADADTSQRNEPTQVALEGERTLLPESVESAPPESQPAVAAQTRLVTGRIVDARGRPLGGLPLRAFARTENSLGRVELPGTRVRATTAADGSYALEIQGWFYELESADADWLLVCEGLPLGGSEALRVAVPSRAIEGTVVDESGRALEGARLEYVFDCTALPEFPYVLYGADRTAGSTRSAEGGRFRFAQLPESIEVEVSLEGYESTRVRALEPFTTIVLRSPVLREGLSIRGLVIDVHNAPVADARVHFGPGMSTADASGRFELVAASYDDATPLVAAKLGHSAARIESFGLALRTERESASEVVLRLGPAALEIAGRVLDAEGLPAVGWWIDLADGTPSGTGARMLEFDAMERTGVLTTDAEGRFRIGGLSARSYRVRAHDSSRCLFLVSEPTEAGSEELELRVPRDAVRPVLRGRVLSERGRPISGAVVRFGFVDHVLPNGQQVIANCRETRADEHGHFEFENATREHVVLYAAGPQIERTELYAIPASGEVELRAGVQCRFRVDLAAHDPAQRLRVLDENGLELEVTAASTEASPGGGVPRGEAGFPVCFVSERAATLVLLSGDSELRRIPLDLDPNELRILAL